MARRYRVGSLCLATALTFMSANASATAILLSQLTGTTGGNGGTAVYGASLNGLGGNFSAISITDISGNFGGSTGAFSGFDLDAIKLSTTSCMTAACAAAAPGLNVFDFMSGVVFSPGTQRAPVQPKLFGTGVTGTTLDNTIATLGAFDAFSSTTSPNGFLSLGDNGAIAFNLTSLTSSAGLYLYIGEVGDNGEIAGSNINILMDPVSPVPEPATWLMMIGGFGLVGSAMRRRPRITAAFA